MKLKLFSLLFILPIVGCEKNSDSTSFKTGASGQGGSLARFTIANNYLYTVDKQNLKVFDISNPAQAVYKRTIPVGFEIETIFPFKDKLFVGSTSMIHIFSITDPASPAKLSEAISPTVMRRCDPVVARDTVAYATLRTNGACGGIQSVLAVYDIRDVLHPVQKATVAVSEPYGLGYSGNTLYVCDRFRGLIVYDISKAYEPIFIRNVALNQTNLIDVIPYNNVLICWATNGMVLYDISSPQNPQLVQQIN